VLDLSEPDGALLHGMQAIIEKAERKSRPKRHTLQELLAEDQRDSEQRAREEAREAREREFNRQRFQQIQNILNRDD
jgi:hypothetical protein